MHTDDQMKAWVDILFTFSMETDPNVEWLHLRKVLDEQWLIENGPAFSKDQVIPTPANLQKAEHFRFMLGDGW
jgi:hypothetical protein